MSPTGPVGETLATVGASVNRRHLGLAWLLRAGQRDDPVRMPMLPLCSVSLLWSAAAGIRATVARSVKRDVDWYRISP